MTLLALMLTACATPREEHCPLLNTQAGQVVITAYPAPVVSDLDYRYILGSRDQAIVQGGFQYALSLHAPTQFSKIKVQGLGKSKPANANNTEQLRALNRRAMVFNCPDCIHSTINQRNQL